MTFPSLGGNLTDPWVDGALVNAAAMKTNTTDKLNALADSLLVKTARVQAKFTCTTVAIASNTPTALTVSAIDSQEGGTFSISGGRVYVPAPGVYNLRLSGEWTTPTPATVMRNYIAGYPLTAASFQDYGFFGLMGVSETKFIFSGLIELKAGALGTQCEVYHNSGGSRTVGTIKGVLTKISD